jgi:4-hydroxy-3-polyprenylbenzoate decarboxylase
MRSNPIYRHIQPTRFTDHHAICEFITAPMLLNVLRSKGLNAHEVVVPLHSALNCAVIQMTAHSKEEVREALLNSMALPFFPRLTIAVDEDVNVYDMNDVMYALSIRVDPSKDIMTVEGIRSFNLEPIGLPITGMEDTILRSGSRLGIDATKPPLSRPEQRIQFDRLQARGEGKVQLKDFI